MSEVEFDRRRDAAFVTFNRPEAGNALNQEMLASISAFLAPLESDRGVRYLVLQGAGSTFSAGGDLTVYARTLRLSALERREFFVNRVRANAECFLRLEALSIPVISLVRGAAAGAGLSFVLASDFVLAADNATLVLAQPRVGLPLDLSLTYHLPRTVGTKIARQLAFTGARLDAARAKELGIVDEIHPADRLGEALASLVKGFSAVAPRAASRSKHLINTSECYDLQKQMEREIQAIGECVTEPDFSEGVEAFLAKRRASFTGAAASSSDGNNQ